MVSISCILRLALRLNCTYVMSTLSIYKHSGTIQHKSYIRSIYIKCIHNMEQQTKQVVDVLGEEECDPTCDFLNCYHRFSLHGHRSHQLSCVCHHPKNAALGVVSK